MTDPHPANAEELAAIATETGADVLRGALRYPNKSGGWQLGDVDLSGHPEKYRDREVVVIIALIGKAGKPQVVCGICGFALDEMGECPRCRLMVKKAARDIERQQEANEPLDSRKLRRAVRRGCLPLPAPHNYLRLGHVNLISRVHVVKDHCGAMPDQRRPGDKFRTTYRHRRWSCR